MESKLEIEKMFADMQLLKDEERNKFIRFDKCNISEENEIKFKYYSLNSSLTLEEVENAELAPNQ